MSDPFDYRDPAGLELELDLPSAPDPRAPARQAPPPADELPSLPDELMELPEELMAPFPEPDPAPAATEAWSLELEDIAPPVATPSIATAPRAAPAARAAAALALPQPTLPLDPPPVRTLELRIAQAVDRMSPFSRGGLLALTIAAMLLLATSVLMAGVRSALNTMEELRQAGADATPSPHPAPHRRAGAATPTRPIAWTTWWTWTTTAATCRSAEPAARGSVPHARADAVADVVARSVERERQAEVERVHQPERVPAKEPHVPAEGGV